MFTFGFALAVRRLNFVERFLLEMAYYPFLDVNCVIVTSIAANNNALHVQGVSFYLYRLTNHPAVF